jgi:succinate dehydrogenase hydrophobic anchor subunit
MATTKPDPTTRIEGLVLVLILIMVAGFAGAASFTHVKDWTLANSPTGTGEWFGWANAVISELVPIASLLTIRRRRRTGSSIGYPMFLLIAAAGLSLAAQLAVAKSGPSGWLLSAVPALAFMALVKLVLAPVTTTDGHTTTEPATEQAAAAPADLADLDPVGTDPATVPAVVDVPSVPATPAADPVPVDRPQVPTHLLPTARFAAVQHEQTTGRPITADELATRMSVTPAVAGQLLDLVHPPADASARINGTVVLGGAR